MSRSWRSGIRWLASLLLLALVVALMEPASLGARLKSIDPLWVALALLITPLQVVASAWRWRYTLQRLGQPLGLSEAVREYYLATLINQVVPGGMVGDAGRALRHSQRTTTTIAIHGVMIERLSGQLVLVATGASLLLIWLPLALPPMPGLFLLPGMLVAGLLLWSVSRSSRVRRWWAGFRADLGKALLAWPALPVQLLSSLLIIASYLAVFWALAVGLGIEAATTAPMLLLGLCTVLLLAMVVPVTVSGWGVREGAAAMIWPLAGLDPEQGVALAVSYGVVVLVSALPGALFLFSGWRGNPGQKACRCPD